VARSAGTERRRRCGPPQRHERVLSCRRALGSLEDLDNQSALFRSTFELFVEATEKAVEDLEFVGAYEEWSEADDEGKAVRSGALGAAADRWRDE
jgi:hypothetical protein